MLREQKTECRIEPIVCTRLRMRLALPFPDCRTKTRLSQRLSAGTGTSTVKHNLEEDERIRPNLMTPLAATPHGGRRSYCTRSGVESEAVHIGTMRRNTSKQEVFNNHEPACVDHQSGPNSINNQFIETSSVISKITIFSTFHFEINNYFF